MNKLKSSIKELKNVSSLCFAAMLLALRVVLGTFTVLVLPEVKIGFSFLPTAMAGYLFGPFVSAMIGGLGDIISYFFNPTGGAYFPGFTINGIILGLLYGFFFYKNKITLKKAIICEIINVIFIELLLSSLWLNIMLGKGFFIIMISRIIKACVMAPIDIALIMTFGKIFEKIPLKNKT